MPTYNWEQKDWPSFTYNLEKVEDSLFVFSEKTGHVEGVFKALPKKVQEEAVVDTVLTEALKTSEIEGQVLSRKDVLSSIRKNLGLVSSLETIKDKNAAGIGELMIDMRNTFNAPLTAEKLFAWHRMLFAGSKGLKIGEWRSHAEPMRVVSGAIGDEVIHFEAPPSAQVPQEMERFIKWFNDSALGGSHPLKKAAVRAAIAHLYFETIHPFEDGNGRIGRVIAEKALAQGVGHPVLLSLSSIIEANKRAYYEALKAAQRSNEITAWIGYFVETVLTAQLEVKQRIDFTLKKVKFFDRFKSKLDERQLKVLKRMLEDGPEGFEGGMNASKYKSITGVSKATATRDLQSLLEMGALVLMGEGGGRSTRYAVNL